MRAALLAIAIAAGWLATAAGEEPAADRVDRLISRLGSGVFRDREAATRELDAIGAAGLEALRHAAMSADPETRRRASDLFERISDRLAAARMLVATSIEFDYRDKPLEEAVRDLARRASGPDAGRGNAAITLYDPSNSHYRGRTVTVATRGPLPFWDALELFCRKADLHDWDGFSPVPGMGNAQQTGDVLIRGGFQGQVMFRGARPNRVNMPAPNSIILLDGPGPALPTCRSGAVRVRIPPPATRIEGLTQIGADEVVLPLHILAEPKLQWQGALDVRIDRALDERGHALTAAAAARDTANDEDEILIFNPINGMIMQNPLRRPPVGVRVQRGDKQSTRVAELAGAIFAQVRLAEPLIYAESPLKLAGQTIRGNCGACLRFNSATRAENGDVTVGVEVQLPSDVLLVGQNGNQAAMMVGGAMMLQGGVVVRQGGIPAGQQAAVPTGTTEYQGLAMEDAKGRRFAVTRGLIEANRFAPEGMVYQFGITFKPAETGQEPTRLVFTGTRPATVEVPFLVKDIPLQ